MSLAAGGGGGTRLLREGLVWSLPALAALVLLGLLGAAAALPLLAAFLLALVSAGWLASRRLLEIERFAAWLEQLPDAQAAAGADAATAGSSTLADRLTRPVGELARRMRRQDRGMAVQQQLLASVVEAMPDPILIVDGARTVIRSNLAAQRRLGLDGRSRPLAAVLRDPGVLAAVSGALEAGSASGVTFSPTLDRSKRFSARIEPVDLGERGTGVLIALREETEQVMIERMRSDFVANASHEIRNPLASIQGTIETLRGPARHDPQAREMFLELMAGEAARMARLVDDLLSLSRIELAALQPPTGRAEPRAVLEQVLARMEGVAAAAGVDLAAALPAALPALVGDPDQLHQLLVNLIDNAIKYGGEGKRVVVAAEALAAAPAEAGPVAGRPALRVSVSDEGPGIPREHIPRLTERFYRVENARSRRLRGTGLGLAIVKHILRRHQGHLVIESEIGRGSRFSVFLPTAPNEAPAEVAAMAASVTGLSR